MSETLILPSPSAIEETDTDGPLLVLPAGDSVEALLALARVHPVADTWRPRVQVGHSCCRERGR